MPIEPQPSTTDQPPTDHRLIVGTRWVWVLSLGIGSLIIAAFLPIFLIAAGASFLALGYLFAGSNKARSALHSRLNDAHSERKQALYHADLLQGLIDAANIPILATDTHGQIAKINRQADVVLGIGFSMIGRRFDEILPQGVLHELESLARQNEPGHALLTLPIKGEMRDFDVAADPVPISKGAVLTFTDITELSRAMTLKADFVANASHELRTPIASIKVALETLTGSAKDDPQMSARLIEMIATNADRLELLAKDLLDLSMAESGDQPIHIERIAVNELIERKFAGFAPAAERTQIKLIAEIDPAVQHITTDPALLSLILRNLIQNAIKFAHPKSTVRVVLSPSRVPGDRSIPIPESLDQPMGIELLVIDKGVGIPLHHQPRIFERFYQVDDARAGGVARRGTGLGLAIVKHAAKRLGGYIDFESVHQVGTTMRVKLPRCLPEPSASDQDSGSANH